MLEILITSLCILSLIHFIWIFWQWMIIRQLANRKVNLQNEFPSISIVIAARNEIENLKTLIPRLKSLEYSGDWEVIIVSDASDDGSLDFLNSETQTFQRLKVIEQSSSEHETSTAPKKSALDKAIKAARYDYVLQTDADCLPISNQWIQEMSGRIKKENSIVLGLSFYAFEPSIANAVSRFDSFLTAINMISLTLANKPYMAIGRNWLFPKKLFMEKEGYADQMKLAFGDDDLLFQKFRSQADVQVQVNFESQTVSRSEKSLKDFMDQKTRHQMAGKHYPLKDKLRLLLSYFPLIIWISVFISMFYGSIVWGILLIRGILTAFVYKEISKSLNTKFNFAGLVFYELIHSLVSLLTSTKAIASKTIRWK